MQEIVWQLDIFKELVQKGVSSLNATISKDLLLLDSLNDFCDTELEDYDIIESYREVA